MNSGKAGASSERWTLKLNKVNEWGRKQLEKSIQKCVDKLYLETAKNLEGPRYGVVSAIAKRGPRKGKWIQLAIQGEQTGKMPIPRITGMLSRSLIKVRVTQFFYFVGASKKIAAHAEKVHNHPKNPREYMGNPVEQLAEEFQLEYREVLNVIRKVGRA